MEDCSWKLPRSMVDEVRVWRRCEAWRRKKPVGWEIECKVVADYGRDLISFGEIKEGFCLNIIILKRRRLTWVWNSNFKLCLIKNGNKLEMEALWIHFLTYGGVKWKEERTQLRSVISTFYQYISPMSFPSKNSKIIVTLTEGPIIFYKNPYLSFSYAS